MKQVIYTDNKGRRHLSTIRDNDTDPSIGFLQSPPNLDNLDWEQILTKLHNLLMDKKLLSLRDIQQRTGEFQWCINASVTKSIFELYRQYSDEGEDK